MQFLPNFLQGYIVGLAIAAPVGPIGVLCIRRTLTSGRLIGFLSGLGAATADMCYGAVAAFGLTALQNLLLRQQVWLHIAGGSFLIYLGLRTFFSRPSQQAAVTGGPPGRSAAYLSTFGLTLTNPLTILSFAAIFAGLRPADASVKYGAAAIMVCGVFLGSAGWWLILTGVVGAFRERFTPTWMPWVNRAAGTVLLAFGLATLSVR